MRTMRWTTADAGDGPAPPWWLRPAVGAGIGTVAVAVLDGGIAGAAQRSGRLWMTSFGGTWFANPLVRHMLAMASLALLTVAVATALARQGARLLAGLVILAVVAGPMAVAGPPVSRTLLDGSWDPRWWRLLVAAVHVVALSAWTWWTSSVLPDRGAPSAPAGAPSAATGPATRATARRTTLAGAVLFLVVAVAVLGVQALAGWGQVQEDVGVAAMLGWALLGAGLAATVAGSGRRWTGPVTCAASAGVLALLSAAYDRDSGWPGVAGWEVATPPFVLSWSATVAVCAAPLAGVAWRWIGRVPPSR